VSDAGTVRPDIVKEPVRDLRSVQRVRVTERQCCAAFAFERSHLDQRLEIREARPEPIDDQLTRFTIQPHARDDDRAVPRPRTNEEEAAERTRCLNSPRQPRDESWLRLRCQTEKQDIEAIATRQACDTPHVTRSQPQIGRDAGNMDDVLEAQRAREPDRAVEASETSHRPFQILHMNRHAFQ
jgi:hypothetical protein